MKRFFEYISDWRAPAFLAVFLAGGVALLALWWGALNQDEGWYLYAAQLVREGRMPYRDFFFTQGPAMPFVYALFAPIWSPASPLHGLLGGRVVTLFWGLCGTCVAMALVRRLVAPGQRAAAAVGVFALLAGNLYHVYFTTIPKTYALGGAFVLAGFWCLAAGLGVGRAVVAPAVSRWRCAGWCACAGLALACASGTRLSLVFMLPVVGVALFAHRGTRTGAFLGFACGGVLGLALTYGYFICDAAAREGLFAAQEYHAARGTFNPFFALGALSRLARGYVALGAVAIAAVCAARRAETGAADAPVAGPARFFVRTAVAAGLAVFLVQLAAPFPYDDYQVPVIGLVTVLVTARFFRDGAAPVRRAWFAVAAAVLASASAPQLQSWMTYGQDRFWTLCHTRSELSKLRMMAEEVNLLDPGGTLLLTQDLYLAVEAGRHVPPGLEMGPFAYFPDWSEARARARHVHTTATLEALIAAAPAPVAALSGYSFAIAAPSCQEVPFDRQKRLLRCVKEKYELVDSEPHFGQNATTLLLLRRKAPAASGAPKEGA